MNNLDNLQTLAIAMSLVIFVVGIILLGLRKPAPKRPVFQADKPTMPSKPAELDLLSTPMPLDGAAIARFDKTRDVPAPARRAAALFTGGSNTVEVITITQDHLRAAFLAWEVEMRTGDWPKPAEGMTIDSIVTRNADYVWPMLRNLASASRAPTPDL